MPAASAAEISYNRHVRPILTDRCFACHGRDAKARKAKLRLDVREAALKSVIVRGNADKSELIARVTHSDPDERMPPLESKKRTLTGSEVDVLRRWIDQGAPYEPHWAFIPPKRPPLPAVEKVSWPRNPIDRFVLARLEREGLSPSPPADRRTLIRRVTLELTGLPPTPAEVEGFLNDKSPSAYASLVDRLLASPRYGEHLAAYWLDAARYADTDGYQNDRYRYMHVWRDWVILAINENKPFDRFVIEQLAGDMLPDATLKQQIATGFCRNHRINSEAGSIPAEWHVENVVDRVDTLGTVLLGLTLGCARCHDHKFDPISQKEYYHLYAFFNNVPEHGLGPNNGNSPPFIRVPKSWPNLKPGEDRLIPPAPLKLQKGAFSGGVIRPVPGKKDTVMVMSRLATPRPTYLLRRGQYNQPDTSAVLEPRVPSRLNTVPGKMPSNRLELARWLVHPRNPLTARVTVNRFWQQVFGTGIVETSENFGSQGKPPSHPALLDWIAVDFIEGGWDVKSLFKRIVMSATYRQSADTTPALSARDPNNRLLARGPRFRLSAFMLRDQALAASGLLVEKIGGPPAKPYMPPRVWKTISNNKYTQGHGENLYRRSLYTYWRRTIPPPTMVNFNAVEREVCVVRKDRTNTPLQALTLMNNVTFVEAARFLAERMMAAGAGDSVAGMAAGFRLVLARDPDARESAVLRRAHARFRDRYRRDPDAVAALLKTGEKPRNGSLDAAEHAAMTMIASMILNLDETVTKE